MIGRPINTSMWLTVSVIALLAGLGSAGEDTTSLEGSGHIVGFGEVEASYV